MNTIIFVGMDVHSTNYTFCCLQPSFVDEDKFLGITQTAPGYKNVLKYLDSMKKKLGEVEFVCGYEAGCLGYMLYHQLTDHGIQCHILAPSTMLSSKGKRIKTDKRDAKLIAQCLAYGTYSKVYIPTAKDEEIREYIRMRDDHKIAAKKIKQQINAFCLRHDKKYLGKTKWTGMHVSWLWKLDLSPMLKEVLNSYLVTLDQLSDEVASFDKRIEELAAGREYAERVKRLTCLLGIKTPSALSLVVETGDFKRFPKGSVYAAYLGLTPSEDSSSDDVRRGRISKAGNSHIRKLLIEAAQAACRGAVGYKSRELKVRQEGNSAEVIAYADKGNRRFRQKYYHMMFRGKNKNVAVAAIAREMACFIWGLMVDDIQPRKAA
ncbi:IS110 family RNA-guided transposase [Hungatella hathewayi]